MISATLFLQTKEVKESYFSTFLNQLKIFKLIIYKHMYPHSSGTQKFHDTQV